MTPPARVPSLSRLVRERLCVSKGGKLTSECNPHARYPRVLTKKTSLVGDARIVSRLETLSMQLLSRLKAFSSFVIRHSH